MKFNLSTITPPISLPTIQNGEEVPAVTNPRAEHIAPPVPLEIQLLSDIKDILLRREAVDVPSDYLRVFTYPVILGVAGNFDVPTFTDFEYWHIYNAPAAGSVAFGGNFLHPIDTFLAGETVWGRVPRGSVLSLQYNAPAANGTFIIKLGTRPLEVYKA